MNATLKLALRDHRLPWPARGLLVFLHDELVWDEWRPMKVAYAGALVRISRSKASEYVQALVRYGYLQRGALDVQTGFYTFRLARPTRLIPTVPDTGTSQAA